MALPTTWSHPTNPNTARDFRLECSVLLWPFISFLFNPLPKIKYYPRYTVIYKSPKVCLLRSRWSSNLPLKPRSGSAHLLKSEVKLLNHDQEDEVMSHTSRWFIHLVYIVLYLYMYKYIYIYNILYIWYVRIFRESAHVQALWCEKTTYIASSTKLDILYTSWEQS